MAYLHLLRTTACTIHPAASCILSLACGIILCQSRMHNHSLSVSHAQSSSQLSRVYCVGRKPLALTLVQSVWPYLT